MPFVGWTIFTAVDLFIGVLLLGLMATSVPPEKLSRLRTARKVSLVLLGVTLCVLLAQIAHRQGWLGR